MDTIISKKPRLKIGGAIFPLKQQRYKLLTLNIDLIDNTNTPTTPNEAALKAQDNADIWHRHLGHVNERSMEVMKKLEGLGVAMQAQDDDDLSEVVCYICNRFGYPKYDCPNNRKRNPTSKKKAASPSGAPYSTQRATAIRSVSCRRTRRTRRPAKQLLQQPTTVAPTSPTCTARTCLFLHLRNQPGVWKLLRRVLVHGDRQGDGYNQRGG